MRAYAPYFDSRTNWYGDAWFYKDSYAIYPGEDRASRTRPRSCATGAATALHPVRLRRRHAARSTRPTSATGTTAPHWIADAKATLAQGYKGIFVDDVNMEMRVSDGNGNPQWRRSTRAPAAR